MTESNFNLKNTITGRRTFLQWSIFSLLFALFAGFLNVVVRYLMPAPKKTEYKELTIPVTQIPLGESLIVKYKEIPVILIHTKEGISAFNATCTHLACLVKWINKEKIFYCPCHAGKFDPSGKVIGGPPPEPLHRIQIDIKKDLIVFI
jgi:cytochrome b6-f complex iron-sulfur subunit